MAEREAPKIVYNAVPTLAKFHASNALYRGVMGPVRSGKSTGMCFEIMRRAIEQQPYKGIRRTRWAVVRNTYPELRDTTLKTWLMWFQEDQFGKFNLQRMQHNIRFSLPDDTIVETEVLFRALDRPDDVRKLLSLELTGAWTNETREIPKAIIDALGDRVGQFPSKHEGGCTWRGVIMDTNPPDEDHWYYKLAEEERPPGWEFFRQPGALIEREGKFLPNPAAENIKNLNEGHDYYLSRVAGKSIDYIRVYYCAQYGFVIDGKPVIHEYVDAVHCALEPIQPNRNLTVYVGLDFGLTPAALFAQRYPNGRWAWIDELVSEDMGITRFAEILQTKIHREYPGFEFEFYGDPAGNQRMQTDEKTCFQILHAKGIPAVPAPTNDFTVRREAIAVPLSRLIDGQPGLIVSPKCKYARKGLAGGYCYKRLKVAGDERYRDKPDKTIYSHVVDAGGYAMVGGGEGNKVVSNAAGMTAEQARRLYQRHLPPDAQQYIHFDFGGAF